MDRHGGMICAWLLAAAVAVVPARATAQSTAPEPPQAPAGASDPGLPITPSDLARIKKALETEPALKIDDSQLRYYVAILAKERTFADYVKGYDLRNGPTRGGNPMTHQEFLSLVTPKELHSSGGITAYELLQFSFTNWLGQTLVKKAVEDLKNARDANEVDEIRARIDRELAALPRSKPN